MDGRAVVELLAHLDGDGQEQLWPVAVVAESLDDRSVVFRTYCSQWQVDGRREHARPAILSSAADLPGRCRRPLRRRARCRRRRRGGRHLRTGRVLPRGRIGPRATHRGAAELRSFFAALFSAGGGISLQPCVITDDGVRCAIEYNCVRWGGRELPPQAGLCVCERGPDGLLAAVREYDDLEPPD